MDGVHGLCDRGCQVVVITLGEKGGRVVKAAASGHPEEDHLIEAVATQVVDTTGASDTFAAGFLYGVLGRKDLPTLDELETRPLRQEEPLPCPSNELCRLQE